MRKKGQAAMEFLMTYGWAILVVLVVIGALAYFGVLNPQQFLPKKCLFVTGLVCEDSKFTAPADVGTGQIRINNGLGNDIQVTSLNITSEAGGVMDCEAIIGETLSAGQTSTYTLDCTGTGTAGTRFKAGMVFVYTDLQTSFDHTIRGSLLTDIE